MWSRLWNFQFRLWFWIKSWWTLSKWNKSIWMRHTKVHVPKLALYIASVFVDQRVQINISPRAPVYVPELIWVPSEGILHRSHHQGLSCPKTLSKSLGCSAEQSSLRFWKNRSKPPSLKTYIFPRWYQYSLPLLGTLNFLPAWVLQRAREPPNPGRTLLLVERSNLELEPKPNCFQSETKIGEKKT